MKIHLAVMKRMAGASSSTATVRGEREVARGERKREEKKKREKKKTKNQGMTKLPMEKSQVSFNLTELLTVDTKVIVSMKCQVPK